MDSVDSQPCPTAKSGAGYHDLAGLIEQFLEVTDRSNGTRLIGGREPEILFKPTELKILDEELRRIAEPDQPVGQPDATIVIKATRLCNLRCSYCNSWGEGPGNVIRSEEHTSELQSHA